MSVPSSSNQATIYQRPVELLQNLIRFNTTNPPGNEAECIGYINHLLTAAGFETALLARDPARPNLVTRLAGKGEAPPLLLYGHVDVVPTENQVWQHPPFEGKMVNGYVWGRGALDMKGGLTMLLAALLRAKGERLTPDGDVVLAVVCDEETGGEYGAKFLVESHPVLFEGIRYAIGEFGGFTFYIGKQKFYPIMVAEKQLCLIKATVRGPSGHASNRSQSNSAPIKLARFLQQLDKRRLPVHVTPVVRQMFETSLLALPFLTRLVLSQFLNPALADRVLNLLGPRGRNLDPLLHNIVNVTKVSGGEQIWGIPSEIVVELAGSALPGNSPEDLIAELQKIVGDEVQLEVTWRDPGTHPDKPDMGLFDTLRNILQEADPKGVPVPFLIPGASDGRHFARLGIQTYGFLPMKLPPEFDFSLTMHAADERIPVEALDFGTAAIYEALQRFGSK